MEVSLLGSFQRSNENVVYMYVSVGGRQSAFVLINKHVSVFRLVSCAC